MDKAFLITPKQVVPLLLKACPALAATWAEVEVDHLDEIDGAGRLHYLDAGAFVRHFAELEVAGERDCFRAIFDVIEQFVTNGDPYVENLGIIGYLEGLQMATVTSLGIDPEIAFRPWLAPNSEKWWRRINAFWGGDHTALQADE